MTCLRELSLNHSCNNIRLQHKLEWDREGREETCTSKTTQKNNLLSCTRSKHWSGLHPIKCPRTIKSKEKITTAWTCLRNCSLGLTCLTALLPLPCSLRSCFSLRTSSPDFPARLRAFGRQLPQEHLSCIGFQKEDVTQPSCTSQHITSMCSRASCHATFPGRQHWCPIHSAQSNADTLDTLGQLSLRKRNTPQTTTDHTLSCHCARRDRNEASLFLNAWKLSWCHNFLTVLSYH